MVSSTPRQYGDKKSLSNHVSHLPQRTNHHGKSIPHRGTPSTAAPNKFVPKHREPWRDWLEVSIQIMNLPVSMQYKIGTLDIYKMFDRAGNIVKIDIEEDRDGRQTGVAEVTFSPAPSQPIWNQTDFAWRMPDGEPLQLRMRLREAKRKFLHRSPVNYRKFYRERMTIQAMSLDFCLLVEQDIMMQMRSVQSNPQQPVNIILNLLRRELIVEFGINMTNGNPKESRLELYKFVVPLSHVEIIWRRAINPNQLELILPLRVPPQFFRRHKDIEATHEADGRFWKEDNAWFRQTDIMYNLEDIKKEPCTLRKRNAEIDMGRWLTYRLVFDERKFCGGDGFGITEALTDYNIKFLDPGFLTEIPRRVYALWDFFDFPSTPQRALDELNHKIIYLPFRIRYQLEVCLSQGDLNEYNLTEQFLHRLSETNEEEAVRRLEHVADQGKRVFDPMQIFAKPKPSPTWGKLPKHLVFVRSAMVTPSTIIYSSPTVDTSNRVVRHFLAYADRFLRVRFTDEQQCGKIFSRGDDSLDALYTRVKRCLSNGIKIGDRHYKYLASGNAQFREHGAYFFAPTPDLSIQNIRDWMGNFEHIKTVAKYASRVGQCFSTTRAITSTRVTIKEIDDIERNGFNFTDGVGMISKFLAQSIAIELGLPDASENPPAVFQFRLGGSKGVFAVSPEARFREVCVRPSQRKFVAEHRGLEIIRWSFYSMPQLNRQLITVLSTLGVKPAVFVKKLKAQLSSLEIAMQDPKQAVALLEKRIDPNKTTLNIAKIVRDGFMSRKDPFTISILRLWRAWSIKNLKEKASIDIEKGAFVLGCVDETATLKGHFNVHKAAQNASQKENYESLPEIFLRIKKPGADREYLTIQGICIVARNPSLHPGDVRIVRAIDVPALHHIRDAVVFPQTGDRDIPGMCSGGDLDGDDFFVSWDPDLTPREWNLPAMDFTGLKPDVVERVQEDDITSFFVNYMKNDCLGIIANSHLANSDRLEGGVKHERCLALAHLHSIAVDYNKSGKAATMKKGLRPYKYPHFMESKYRPKDQYYISTNILGQLYDAVALVGFDPIYDLSFDKRILDAFEIDADTLHRAMQLKLQYDAAVRRVMAQHDIGTEFEVWSTLCMQHAKLSNDYKFHEELGRLSEALLSTFRASCEAAAGGKDSETFQPFVVAMYKVTAEHTAATIQALRDRYGIQPGMPLKFKPDERPLISFPWMFHQELGKIAKQPGLNKSGIHVNNQAQQHGSCIVETPLHNHLRKPDPDISLPLTNKLHLESTIPTSVPTASKERILSEPSARFSGKTIRSEKQINAENLLDEATSVSASRNASTNAHIALPPDDKTFQLPGKNDKIDFTGRWDLLQNRAADMSQSIQKEQQMIKTSTEGVSVKTNYLDDLADLDFGLVCDIAKEDRQLITAAVGDPESGNDRSGSSNATPVFELEEVEEVELDIDDEPSALEKLNSFLQSR